MPSATKSGSNKPGRRLRRISSHWMQRQTQQSKPGRMSGRVIIWCSCNLHRNTQMTWRSWLGLLNSTVPIYVPR